MSESSPYVLINLPATEPPEDEPAGERPRVSGDVRGRHAVLNIYVPGKEVPPTQADLDAARHAEELGEWLGWWLANKAPVLLGSELVPPEVREDVRRIVEGIDRAVWGPKREPRARRINVLRALDDAAGHPDGPMRFAAAVSAMKESGEVTNNLPGGEADMAVATWLRGRGRPKKGEARSGKWEWLASLMQTLGLGLIAPRSLQRDWEVLGLPK